MKQLNSFQNTDTYQRIENEYFLRKTASRQKSIPVIPAKPVVDTSDWLFGTDMDIELDLLENQFTPLSFGEF